MNYKQAADILDPATSREALLPYAYDPQYQQMLLRDACQLAAQVLRDRNEEIRKISENVTGFGTRYRMTIERLKALYLRSADEKGKILGMERYVFANYMFDTMRVIEGLLLQNVSESNEIPSLGDKIRSMTDKELSLFIYKVQKAVCAFMLGALGFKDEKLDFPAEAPDLLDWIKSPAKEE